MRNIFIFMTAALMALTPSIISRGEGVRTRDAVHPDAALFAGAGGPDLGAVDARVRAALVAGARR